MYFQVRRHITQFWKKRIQHIIFWPFLEPIDKVFLNILSKGHLSNENYSLGIFWCISRGIKQINKRQKSDFFNIFWPNVSFVRGTLYKKSAADFVVHIFWINQPSRSLGQKMLIKTAQHRTRFFISCFSSQTACTVSSCKNYFTKGSTQIFLFLIWMIAIKAKRTHVNLGKSYIPKFFFFENYQKYF